MKHKSLLVFALVIVGLWLMRCSFTWTVLPYWFIVTNVFLAAVPLMIELHQWMWLAVVVLAAAVIFVLYSTKRFIPGKYLFPGTFFLAVFLVTPIILTIGYSLTNFGDGGRQPGQFYGVHSIATDSKGNLYTTETYEGKRVQKFVYKGIGTVAAGSQGVLWPK